MTKIKTYNINSKTIQQAKTSNINHLSTKLKQSLSIERTFKKLSVRLFYKFHYKHTHKQNIRISLKKNFFIYFFLLYLFKLQILLQYNIP